MSTFKFDGKVDVKTFIVIGGLIAGWIAHEYTQSGDINMLKISSSAQNMRLDAHDKTLEDRAQWGGIYSNRLTTVETEVKFLKDTLNKVDNTTQKILECMNVKNCR
jgi:hypothetical protein